MRFVQHLIDAHPLVWACTTCKYNFNNVFDPEVLAEIMDIYDNVGMLTYGHLVGRHGLMTTDGIDSIFYHSVDLNVKRTTMEYLCNLCLME